MSQPSIAYPWDDARRQLLEQWDAAGITIVEQVAELARRYTAPCSANMVISQRRRQGLAPRVLRWPDEAVALLHRHYGLMFAQDLADLITRETGWTCSLLALEDKVKRDGLNVLDQHGQLTLKDAAGELSICDHTLTVTIRQLHLVRHGRGRVRTLDDRTMACLRAVFPRAQEPSTTPREVAIALQLRTSQVIHQLAAGAIDGQRWGLARGWLVPTREITRLRAPAGWVRRAPVLPPSGLTPGAYVLAARPLLAIPRADGTLLAPSPGWRMTTFRKHAPLGQVVGYVGSRATLQTLYGQVVVDVEHLTPEVDQQLVRRPA